MARAKKKRKSGESALERFVGTALTSVVLAKVAFDHHDEAEGGVAGRPADSPAEIPAAGWKDVFERAFKHVKADGVPLLSGGVAYYAFLALFPALIALVSIYGLVASPSEVATQMQSLTRALPAQARDLIITQLTALTQKSNAGLGVGAVVSLVAALWSASSGMRWLMTALSSAYETEETRKFVKLRGTALLLTLAAVVGGAIAVGLLVALPNLVRVLGLGSVGRVVVSVLRWPLLAALVVTALSVLYRYGADREEPQWRWVTPGSVAATFVWLVASVGFSVYASVFGKFDKTYGSLGAVIVLLLWLFLTAFSVLLGAEINAEVERVSHSQAELARRAQWRSGRSAEPDRPPPVRLLRTS